MNAEIAPVQAEALMPAEQPAEPEQQTPYYRWWNPQTSTLILRSILPDQDGFETAIHCDFTTEEIKITYETKPAALIPSADGSGVVLRRFPFEAGWGVRKTATVLPSDSIKFSEDPNGQKSPQVTLDQAKQWIDMANEVAVEWHEPQMSVVSPVHEEQRRRRAKSSADGLNY